MSTGINKVTLIGHLGADPHVINNEKGSISHLSIATGSAWKDKNTGQKVEHTEWHRVVFFGRLAEVAEQYLKKGARVYIEGSLRTRKWQDKASGADRFTTEIIAQVMQMLGGKSDGGGQDQNPYQNSQANSDQQYNTGTWSSAPPAEGQFDDDIPF